MKKVFFLLLFVVLNSDCSDDNNAIVESEKKDNINRPTFTMTITIVKDENNKHYAIKHRHRNIYGFVTFVDIKGNKPINIENNAVNEVPINICFENQILDQISNDTTEDVFPKIYTGQLNDGKREEFDLLYENRLVQQYVYQYITKDKDLEDFKKSKQYYFNQNYKTVNDALLNAEKYLNIIGMWDNKNAPFFVNISTPKISSYKEEHYKKCTVVKSFSDPIWEQLQLPDNCPIYKDTHYSDDLLKENDTINVLSMQAKNPEKDPLSIYLDEDCEIRCEKPIDLMLQISAKKHDVSHCLRPTGYYDPSLFDENLREKLQDENGDICLPTRYEMYRVFSIEEITEISHNDIKLLEEEHKSIKDKYINTAFKQEIINFINQKYSYFKAVTDISKVYKISKVKEDYSDIQIKESTEKIKKNNEEKFEYLIKILARKNNTIKLLNEKKDALKKNIYNLNNEIKNLNKPISNPEENSANLSQEWTETIKKNNEEKFECLIKILEGKNNTIKLLNEKKDPLKKNIYNLHDEINFNNHDIEDRIKNMNTQIELLKEENESLNKEIKEVKKDSYIYSNDDKYSFFNGNVVNISQRFVRAMNQEEKTQFRADNDIKKIDNAINDLDDSVKKLDQSTIESKDSIDEQNKEIKTFKEKCKKEIEEIKNKVIVTYDPNKPEKILPKNNKKNNTKATKTNVDPNKNNLNLNKNSLNTKEKNHKEEDIEKHTVSDFLEFRSHYIFPEISELDWRNSKTSQSIKRENKTRQLKLELDDKVIQSKKLDDEVIQSNLNIANILILKMLKPIYLR